MRRFSVLPVVVLFVLSPMPLVYAQSTMSCDSFGSQSSAQLILDLSETHTDALDPDGDGIACNHEESLSQDDDESPSIPEQDTTETGEITDQEQEYLDKVGADALEFGDSLNEAAILFGEAADDPLLLFDENWIIAVAAHFFTWQQIGDRAQMLEPSPRQAHIHALWLEIHRLTGLAIVDYTAFIDELDVDAASRGVARFIYITILTNDSSAAAVAFQADPNNAVDPVGVIAPVVDCEAFEDFDAAQDYYGANPEEQPTINPDFDGLACEVHFGV